MKSEVKVNERIAQVELIEKLDNKIKIKVDDNTYELDAVMVENGVYSILYNNKSYNVELIEGDHNKQYLINTLYDQFTTEIIDAEARYQMSRKSGQLEDDASISSPMPGKVVKILVEEGQEVKEGQTVIIVSAMKMESEYKVKQDRIIKAVCVAEGDNITANQPLIIVE